MHYYLSFYVVKAGNTVKYPGHVQMRKKVKLDSIYIYTTSKLGQPKMDYEMALIYINQLTMNWDNQIQHIELWRNIKV
jgi:hypothetical protein